MRWLPKGELARLIVLTILGLPLWFAAWYYGAPLLQIPAVFLSEWAINLAFPELLEGIEGFGDELLYVTNIEVPVPNAPPGAVGQVMVPVNGLMYSWNFPVLLALLFAADERYFTFTRLLIAYVGLIPFHVWGISFDVIKTLAIDSGPQTREALALEPWQIEAVGLAYQFGYLMLPVIGAATLWIAMNRRLINSLVKLDR